MLFNSYLFLLVFLPLVLAGFYGVGHVAGRTGGLLWLVVASLIFYASWELSYLWLLLTSAGIAVIQLFCCTAHP